MGAAPSPRLCYSWMCSAGLAAVLLILGTLTLWLFYSSQLSTMSVPTLTVVERRRWTHATPAWLELGIYKAEVQEALLTAAADGEEIRDGNAEGSSATALPLCRQDVVGDVAAPEGAADLDPEDDASATAAAATAVVDKGASEGSASNGATENDS